jgi:hypothetical protein
MDAYIKILRYASTLEGFTYENIFTYVMENDLRFYDNHKPTESDSQLLHLFRQDFVDEYGDRPKREPNGQYRGQFYLKPESYQYLLNYEALQQARENAESARIESLKAIKLSRQAVNYAKYSLIATAAIAFVQYVLPYLLS